MLEEVMAEEHDFGENERCVCVCVCVCVWYVSE